MRTYVPYLGSLVRRGPLGWVSCHMWQYLVFGTVFEAISKPYDDSRQCKHVLRQEIRPGYSDFSCFISS